jgi:membrane-bound hydrogenase subunit beta
MREEELIQKQIADRFDFLKDSVSVRRPRRISVEAGVERSREVLEYLHGEAGFIFLATITALDLRDRFQVIYHLSRDGRIMLDLKINVPRENPVIRTVTRLFPNAEIYEREMTDLYGIDVTMLGKGNRYPLPDNWPPGEFPMRKDWRRESPADE